MASHKPRDIYHEVTERIIQALEQGTAPWVRPWSVESDPFPINAATHRRYRGINTLLCISPLCNAAMPATAGSPIARLFHWVPKCGCGEHGVGIVFFRVLEVSPKDQLSRVMRSQDACRA